MITFSAESNEFDPSLPRRANVTLPAWVNEPLPSFSDLLSAHDLARLTRRPRWVLTSLVLLGRFPRKCRYQGRGIGWLRSDVLTWLSKDIEASRCRAPGAARRSRGRCCNEWNGHQ